MHYYLLATDLLLIVVLFKFSERLSKVLYLLLILMMLVRPPDALSDSISATESEVDSQGSLL